MELDELKNAWASLDNRLNKQENLKASIIKEMLISKSNKSLNQMINYNYFGIILCLGGIFLIVWRILAYHWSVFMTSILLFVTAFLVFGMIVGIYYVINLLKIDFALSVRHNISVIQHYKIVAKRNFILSYIVGAIILIIGILVGISLQNMETWRWCVVAGAVSIGIVGAWWEYKQMYRKNVDSILKSLEELKELEEES
jgi:VIT1/CCC1 family predicted Fe2+/Mn2+ transporter